MNFLYVYYGMLVRVVAAAVNVAATYSVAATVNVANTFYSFVVVLVDHLHPVGITQW
jgi:hypothetical protein